jgi:hypothetical protein
VADKGEELGSCFCGAGGAAKPLGGVSREVASWVKNGGGNEGGQVCRLGRGGCELSYPFRFCKWKHIFLKTNMT